MVDSMKKVMASLRGTSSQYSSAAGNDQEGLLQHGGSEYPSVGTGYSVYPPTASSHNPFSAAEATSNLHDNRPRAQSIAQDSNEFNGSLLVTYSRADTLSDNGIQNQETCVNPWSASLEGKSIPAATPQQCFHVEKSTKAQATTVIRFTTSDNAKVEIHVTVDWDNFVSHFESSILSERENLEAGKWVWMWKPREREQEFDLWMEEGSAHATDGASLGNAYRVAIVAFAPKALFKKVKHVASDQLNAHGRYTFNGGDKLGDIWYNTTGDRALERDVFSPKSRGQYFSRLVHLDRG
ncbi:hypothetical protein QFC21_006979 [Naganishia friedmannii]|uniref:Uncharacterized protein n=1 Tax=Naganishia friedmannii TaxID=89922 RepID=A0ACC2UZ44_9TREE|nr:hypothetical protein QFC21_006979 [Naganishia friedmannii]